MNPLVRSLSGFGRPMTDEPSSPEARLMERRLDLFCEAFARASRDCGIKFADSASVKDCADAIVKAAKASKLDPKAYQLAWFVRKTCSRAQQE
jgi:hypothetical protein